MSNCYNLDGVKTELIKRMDESKTLLEAWKKVTFPTKKDGTPFANMAKNICGAKYGVDNYTMQPGENKLTVYAQSKKNGYINAGIDCYCLVKYMTDENKKAKIQNYMPKQSYLEQVYCYDLEDIKQAVNQEIKRLENRISVLETDIDTAQTIYNAFVKRYAEAIQELENAASENGEKTDLYYLTLETVKERFPYC